MKTLVGILIVGWCLAGYAFAGEIEGINAKEFIKVTTTGGKTYSCNQYEISSGCRISFDDKFCILISVPEYESIPTSTARVYFLNSIFKNYKIPINRIKEIEYR